MNFNNILQIFTTYILQFDTTFFKYLLLITKAKEKNLKKVSWSPHYRSYYYKENCFVQQLIWLGFKQSIYIMACNYFQNISLRNQINRQINQPPIVLLWHTNHTKKFTNFHKSCNKRHQILLISGWHTPPKCYLNKNTIKAIVKVL